MGVHVVVAHRIGQVARIRSDVTHLRGSGAAQLLLHGQVVVARVRGGEIVGFGIDCLRAAAGTVVRSIVAAAGEGRSSWSAETPRIENVSEISNRRY